MKDLVSVKTFINRHEAEVAKGFLAQNGVEAVVSVDDAGGHRPDFALISGGVKLLVNKNELQTAKDLLQSLD